MSIDSPDVYLAQGTLRPDLIESASKSVSGNADTIKTHHNDSPMARQYREAGRLVEPLKDFHKDEVRRLGQRLGLPEGINHRQPFPGPGLAIRVLCADNNTVIDDDGSGPSLKMLSNYSHSLKERVTNIKPTAGCTENITRLYFVTQNMLNKIFLNKVKWGFFI